MRNVQDLVNEVISRIDQDNRETITSEDILLALNRGWDDAMDIIATRQEEFLLKSSVIEYTSLKDDAEGNKYFVVPEDCYQSRIMSVDYRDSFTDKWSKATLINAQESRDMESDDFTSQVTSAIFYYFIGRKVIIGPTDLIEVGGTIRIRYVQEPLSLVIPQGRITAFNSNTVTVTLDVIGDDISFLVNDNANYVNVINGQTGEVRATLQAFNKVGTTVLNFRTAPLRSEIHNLPVVGALPVDIEVDDYICLARGSCIPIIDSPVTKMCIEYAVNEMDAKIGTADKSVNVAVMDRFEGKVKSLTKNRPRRLRVNTTAPWSKRFEGI